MTWLTMPSWELAQPAAYCCSGLPVPAFALWDLKQVPSGTLNEIGSATKLDHTSSIGKTFASREAPIHSPSEPTTAGKAWVAAQCTGQPLLRAFILPISEFIQKMESASTGR